MTALSVTLITFACLFAASMSALWISPRLPVHHRNDETNAVVRLVANIFVVMTSLVFGLMINSAKNTFESIDSSVHRYGTSLIIFDRTLRHYGIVASDTRAALVNYTASAVESPARADDVIDNLEDDSGTALEAVAARLEAIVPSDPYHLQLYGDARDQYQSIVQQRWAIVEQSEGKMPLRSSP